MSIQFVYVIGVGPFFSSAMSSVCFSCLLISTNEETAWHAREIESAQWEIGQTAIAQIQFDLKSRDDIPKILRGLQYLYVTDTIREPIFKLKEIAVPIVRTTKMKFSCLKSCSFDKGFHSPKNQESLAEELDVVASKRNRAFLQLDYHVSINNQA